MRTISLPSVLQKSVTGSTQAGTTIIKSCVRFIAYYTVVLIRYETIHYLSLGDGFK